MTVNLTHSFSSIKMFENCPLQYYHVRIAKTVVNKGGEATIWGERVHKQLEERLKKNVELPPETSSGEPICASIEKLKGTGELFVEQEVTLNKSLMPTGWWDLDAWLRSKLDVLIIKGAWAAVFDWKGLAVDTKIPTPWGWTTMGEVPVGAIVFDSTGAQCMVVGKSQVKNLKCYMVTFDDTTSVVCDEEHLWKLHTGDVVGIDALTPRHGKKQQLRPRRVAVAAPLKIPDVQLPIDPYVLGLWLADGKHSSGEISKPDAFIWDEIQRRGYDVDMATGGAKSCPTRTAKGLRSQLIAAKLLRAKHIPQLYMRSGYSQRLDLLRGLMDGDGNANPARKQAVFTNTDERLSDSVCELLCSLGQRPLKSKVKARGFGHNIIAYHVSFRPLGINPFRLPRKAARIDAAWGCGQSGTRLVVSVIEVPSVPTQCIAVDSPDNTFLCTDRMVPTHNTGKRRPDFSQLELFALQVFTHHPQVNTVHSKFLWLKDGKSDHEVYKRDQMPILWEKLMTRIKRIEKAAEANVWPAKPSGLCPYCPAYSFCEYRR